MFEYVITARYDEGDQFSDVTFKIFANSLPEAKSLGRDLYPDADFILASKR